MAQLTFYPLMDSFTKSYPLEQVPAHSEASRLLDAGGLVLAAWWVPYDNIGDLPAIHNIHTVPAGNSVHLKVHGVGHQRSARVRIMIYAHIADNYS